MTPAMLDALVRVHRRVTDPKAKGRGAAQPGGVADLLALQKMKAV